MATEEFVYCTEDGTRNSTDRQTCVTCGRPLPRVMPQPLPGVSPRTSPGQESSSRTLAPEEPPSPRPPARTLIERWANFQPPLRAATGTIFVLLFFSGIKTLIPGIGFLLTMPFQVVLFFIQGVFVAKFARESGITDRSRYVGMAFKSAVWTMLFNFALFVIAMLLATAVSVGAWLLALPLLLLGEAGTMVVMTVSAMLGAWASGYKNGKNLIGISIALILGAFLVLGLLIVTIGVFLYAKFK